MWVPQFTSQIVAVVIVLILVVCLLSHVTPSMRALSGFWVGEPSFLDEAGLVDMCLYVGPPSSGVFAKASRLIGWGYFDCFLLMANSAGVICSQKVEMRTSLPTQYYLPADSQHVEGSCKFVFDDEDECPLPSDVKIALDTSCGALALYDDESLLAYLHKDAAGSEASSDA